jgi:hypothetical protein
LNGASGRRHRAALAIRRKSRNTPHEHGAMCSTILSLLDLIPYKLIRKAAQRATPVE